MLILGEDEIGEFCVEQVDFRDRQLTELAASTLRPARLLPWFQLCSYTHERARAGRLDIPKFRACWSRLVARHYEMGADGYLLHLSDGADADELLKLLRGLARPRWSGQHPRGDQRSWKEERKEQVLRDRFWSFHETMIPKLKSLAEQELDWRWFCTPPDELPEQTYPARDGSPDLVVDTNVLVEILDALPLDASLGMPLDLSTLEAPVRRRVSQVLSDGFGKLIVPASVLIEAEGVIVAKAPQYQHAAAVLDDIAFRPHHPQYAAFTLESLTDESFSAFLHLLEWLIQAGIHRDWWPSLGDALVLAHGLLHGCAVASHEWILKDEWSRTQIDQAFSYLVLT